MAIRNGISSGYPFVEAIKSALPLCDEFLISDGFSEDKTYEVLETLSQQDSRIQLFRDKWDQKSFDGSALKNALNMVRYRCKGTYIFEIDANEIIPEENIPFIRSLPDIYPRDEVFSFPYYQILGSKILFNEEFRVRFSKNRRDIKVLYDANTMGFKYTLKDLMDSRTRKRVKSRILRSILEGRKISSGLPERYIYLPRPIFKYYSIFPENFFNKMKTKRYLQPTKDYSSFDLSSENSQLSGIYHKYKEAHDYENFWEEIYNYHMKFLKGGKSINKEFIEHRIIKESDQPKIIQPQFNKDSYTPPI